MEARRAFIKLYYDGMDISKYIEKDLLSFVYTDNASGYADDVDVTLKDEKGIWLDDWFPEKGDRIQPVIKTKNWRRNEDSQSLDCGSFIIDEPSGSGPPSQIQMKGNSMPLHSNFKEKRSKAWSELKFDALGRAIANRSGLKFFFDSSYNPYIKYELQDKVSDSKFLMDLCNKYGFGFKLSNNTVIVFNISEYESKPSVATIDKKRGQVNSYSVGTTLTETAYTTIKIRYKEEGSDKKKWYVYKPGSAEKEKTHTIDLIAESYEEAERVSISKYKALNKNEFVVSMTVVGNIEILGASCVDVVGFGKFDGKYYVDKATHAVGGGYTTSFDARKVVRVSVIEVPLEKEPSRVLIAKVEPSKPISRMIIM